MAMRADIIEEEGMSRQAKIILGVVVAVVLIAVIAFAVWWFQPVPEISVQAGPIPNRLGALMTVSGVRFPAGKEIYVGLAAPGAPPTGGTTFITVVSGADGKFTASFPYPAEPNWTGMSEVTVYAGIPDGSAVATTRFSLSSIAWLLVPTATQVPLPTVTPLPGPTATPGPSATPTPTPLLVSQIGLQPASARVGALVTVNGRGWRANDQVNFGVSGYPGTVGVANADAQGNLFGSFVFPKDYNGPAITTVVARSRDGVLQASAVFQVIGLATPTAPSPTPLVITGWKGEYYNNPSLLGNPTVIRDDRSIDFDWGSASPAPGIPNERFSVRWTRSVYFSAGNYRFLANVDDGVRLWFDDRPIMDEWHGATGQQYMSDVFNVAEGTHSIRVEFYQDVGPARARVSWQQIASPSQTPTPTLTPTTVASPTPTVTTAPSATPTATTAPSATPTVTASPTTGP